jgi:catechol 2,3-dioxygenase-like lactoylglutathione lyase family enzyme
MKVLGISWLGTRTDQFDAMRDFLRDALGLIPRHESAGFIALDCPNGDRVEVFALDDPTHQHFDAPVAGFEVADIDSARRELEAHGIKFFGPTQREGDSAWAHFTAPDGHVYEINAREARSGQQS